MKRVFVVVISLSFVFILLFIATRWRETAPTETKPAATSASDSTQVDLPSGVTAVAAPNPDATVEEGRSATEKVTRMITAFHTRMGENPVGTNAEITKALMGGNPVHATFSPDPPMLNSKGELIDPWGTPYFFHQISGNQMEIHSAGPDKIMGTADDIIDE